MVTRLETRCGSCGARARYPHRVLVALDAKGSKTMLWHPGEERAAQALGSTIKKLRREGKLRTETPFLCRGCGKVLYASQPPTRCESCPATSCLPVGGASDSAGCLWAMLVPLAVLIALQNKAWLWAGLAVASLPLSLLLIRLQSRSYHRVIRATPCWRCGAKQLTETVIGKS